jgi:hypothetical protein
MSFAQRIADRPRRPWAITFRIRTVLGGLVLATVIFSLFGFLVFLAAPADLLDQVDASPAMIALNLATYTLIMMLLFGLPTALILGWLLRRVSNQSVHIVAFALAGAVFGVLLGVALGWPEGVAAMMTAAVGLTRAILTPLAIRHTPEAED